MGPATLLDAMYNSEVQNEEHSTLVAWLAESRPNGPIFNRSPPSRSGTVAWHRARDGAIERDAQRYVRDIVKRCPYFDTEAKPWNTPGSGQPLESMGTMIGFYALIVALRTLESGRALLVAKFNPQGPNLWCVQDTK